MKERFARPWRAARPREVVIVSVRFDGRVSVDGAVESDPGGNGVAGPQAELVACHTGIELTVAEFVRFDGVPGARHMVGPRLRCGLQAGHREAHVAFAQSPAENYGQAWWLEWTSTAPAERAAVELGWCMAKDPDHPFNPDDEDDVYCELPADHRGVHDWQLTKPELDFSEIGHQVDAAGRDALREAGRAPAGPLIRVHLWEYLLAVKWPDLPMWLVVEPDRFAEPPARGKLPPTDTEAAKSWWVLDSDFSDAQEWVDPAADTHAELRRWTAEIRRVLAGASGSVDGLLRQIEAHPYNR